ncbi:putative ribonuclease H-like domain-containing protein [Tanacetum coccineum]
MMMDLNIQMMMERRLMKIQEKKVNVMIKRMMIMLTALTMLAVGTNEVNAVGEKTSIELPFDPNMPTLEDYNIFNFSRNDEDDGVEADMNNSDTTIQVSHIPTTRIHKDHPLDQVIGDLQLATQTRKMSKNLKEHGFLKEPKKVIHALNDPSWIEAMQEELLQLKLQEVWTLVDLPNRKRAIGTKWVFRNKKDKRGIVIEAIRLFLAYASFKDFVVYQMDVKSAFLYGKIEEEVYVYWYKTLSTYLLDNGFQRGKIDKTLFIKRHKVYVDDIIFGLTNKKLCIAFEKLMHEKFQMSSMGKLTFFLGLQVQQKKDVIFISQDKYVGEILKKFGFIEVKPASTPIETQKHLLKDEDGEEVDVHMYRYLKGQPKLGFWYQKDSPFDLVAYTNSDYAGASLDMKSTTGGCQFLRSRLISWQCKKQIVVANSITKAEYVAALSCCGQVLWIQNQLLDYGNPKRKDTHIPQSSCPTKHVANEAVYNELDDRLVRAATTASSLEVEQDSSNIAKTQSKATPNESSSLGTTSVVHRMPSKKSMGDNYCSKTRFENIWFDVNTLTGDEVLAEQEIATKDVNLTVDEVTLAQAPAALKSVKPKVKANVVEDPSVPVSAASTKVSVATTTTTATILTLRKGIVITELGTSTTTSTISSQPSQAKVQDKGQEKMIEPEKPLKKKYQISFDE